MGEPPAPSSYKEVNVYESEDNSKWISLSVSDSLANESSLVEKPTRGGGFPITHGMPSASRRFLYWRTQGEILELVDISMDFNMDKNKLRIRFESDLIPQVVHFISSYDNKMYLSIFVVTERGRLHRLLLTHPSSMQYGAQSVLFDFKIDTNHRSISVAKGATTTCLSATTEHENKRVIVGAANGSLYMLSIQSNPRVKEFVSAETELIEPGLSYFLYKSSGSPVKAMVYHGGYIYSFCADLKVRVWSTQNNTLVTTTKEISKKGWYSNSDPHKWVILVSSNGREAHVTTALDMKSETVLHTQRIDLNTFVTTELSQSVCVHQGELLDLQRDESTLWGLWKDKKGYRVKYIRSNTSHGLNHATIQSDRWYETFYEPMNTLLDDIVLSGDIEDILCHKLLDPDRIPNSILREALQKYKNSARPIRGESVRVEIIKAIREKRAEETDEARAAERARKMYQEYEVFLQICTHFLNQPSSVCGLIVDRSLPFTAVVKKGGLSILRPMDALETLHSALKSNNQREDDLMSVREKEDREELMRTVDFVCRRGIGKRMSLYDQELYNSSTFDASNQLIQHLTTSTVQNQSSPIYEGTMEDKRESIISEFHAKFHSIREPITVISHIIDDLVQQSQGSDPLTLSSFMHDSHRSRQSPYAGHFSEVLAAQSIRDQVYERYGILRDISVALYLLYATRTKSGLDGEKIDVLLGSLLPRVSSLLVQSVSIKKLVSSFDLTKDKPSTAQTFYRCVSDRFQEEDLWPLLHQVKRAFLSSSDEPNASFLAVMMSARQQWDALADFLSLQKNKRPLSLHLHGVSLLHLAHSSPDTEEKNTQSALDLFHQIGARYESQPLGTFDEGELLMQYISSPFDEPLDNAVRYFAAVARLLAGVNKMDLSALFDRYAIQRATCTPFPSMVDDAESTVRKFTFHRWDSVFNCHLNNKNWKGAYDAICANTHNGDWLNKNLPIFVIALCKEGEFKRLTQYPFVGLQERVKRVLESNAEKDQANSPNYSQILYAFHMSRSNYRQAATAMYNYANRLSRQASGTTLPSIQQQGYSYAVCISALQLVSPDFQYISYIRPEVISAFPHDARDAMEEESMGDEVENVELDAIQKQMILVRAIEQLLMKDQRYQVSQDPLLLMTDLASSNLFDAAVTLGRAFGIKLHPVFSLLVFKYYDTFEAYETKKYCEELNRLLRSLKDRTEGLEYHLYVADRMLQRDAETKLPGWLTKFIEKNNYTEGLVRLYMQYGLIDEAARSARLILYQARKQLEEKKGNGAVWVPHRLIQDVLNGFKLVLNTEATFGKKTREEFEDMEKDLSSDLNGYYSLVQKPLK
ncbi:nuclear pore complex protein [Planoprotostelium fungivorum]|uniref:Nuclear pore complex protein n=1 Tax=Planoprotostelium fungivorum TaxID=1890364 RepID=A0A2P6NA61_9EUKA|nr:nuclear pore complex protein [Planoprotostelium fungivorum]